MKTPSKFTIYDLRFTIGNKSFGGGVAGQRAGVVGNRKTSIGNRKSTAGMALVITLILLSVTLVMAVAFLAVARRGRNAASTSTDTTTARLAAEAALAAAEAQIAANILTTTNPYNFGLVVSTNYISVTGFAAGVANSTNVNYDYYNNGSGPVTGNDLIQNIANLYLLPRVPVFVKTNSSPYGYSFPFYLDLNRNGSFETNNPAHGSPGDPEWIGVPERPDAPHSAENKYLARYAFAAQPIGNTLDLNYIHNQAFTKSVADPNDGSDGYLRNQGIGSWEINLAAFLTDLNTNSWDNAAFGGVYNYQQAGSPNFPNTGSAFYDAFSILRYRYNYNYNNLLTAQNYFANAVTFRNDNIDEYSDGPLQLTTTNINESLLLDDITKSWAGADNPNKFFTLADYFDVTKTGAGFTNRLRSAGSSTNDYDRYTFYRLLGQLGTDSTPPSSGKMNVNYRNLTNGAVVAGMETNLYAWTPLEFFTNAANRMLLYYSSNWLAGNPTAYLAAFNTNAAFGIGNIPVLVSNQMVYSPAVNRVLQLAANIYDASTNSPWPSVFRPTFTVVRNGTYNNVFITGYTYVASVAGPGALIFTQPADAATVAATYTGKVGPTVNIYGVPWIIGAKKGLPNFNRFDMLNAVQVERKLQVTKPYFGATLDLFRTNQMYLFCISNTLGCSLWNSYRSNYVSLNNLTIVARDSISMVLTNDAAGFASPNFINYPIVNLIITNNWPGTAWSSDPPSQQLETYNNSFIIPFNGSLVLLTNSIYRYAGYNGAAYPYFDPYSTAYQTNGLNGLTPQLPHFGLLTTNRLQVFILDGNHVIDYVHFTGPNSSINVNQEIADPDSTGTPAYLWSTNGYNGSANLPWGVVDQILISKGYYNAPNAGGSWIAPPNLPNFLPSTPTAEQKFFVGFYNVLPSQYGKYIFNGQTYYNTNLWVQAPYTPLRTFYDYVSWQANDPLVHYLASDLNYTSDPGTTGLHQSDETKYTFPDVQLANVSQRWSPWGQAYPFGPSIKGGAFLTQIKDSLVWRPDNWDFPTNKYPSVGWLGRVHRGTPWQTVYLKASDILTNAGVATGITGPGAWVQWTGDTNVVNGQYFDAMNSAPSQDGALFDLFTTALNDNATRGTLSINQTGLAAWSAVFGGMVALTNNGPPGIIGYNPTPPVTNMIIQPAGVDGDNSLLAQLVNSINATRTNTSLFPLGAFTKASDILRVSALTEQSPFLNWNDSLQQQYNISDELYEWLPQQTIGLLRVGTPRYVVYCYGQALRPAPGGLVTSGSFFGLVTNYQIKAESALRVVLRVDNATTSKPHIVVESVTPLPPD
jgi:hypothetical protein